MILSFIKSLIFSPKLQIQASRQINRSGGKQNIQILIPSFEVQHEAM
jgi:hypothetical protein